MTRRRLAIVLILLLAFAVRAHQLADLPPGLTHDEANHGRDSLNILDGSLLIYSPIGYGREPLYDYLVAGEMALIGQNMLAMRLVSVYAGLLTVAAVYAWTRRAFGLQAALIAAALLAVSFWPLVTSRQALRSGILPFLTTAAVILFWRIVRERRWRLATMLAFAVAIAATLYTYLAARVVWLLFPAFILYLVLTRRERFRRAWLPTLLGLVLAGLLSGPMFAYIRANPETETRLDMLDQPLQHLVSGNFGPILENALGGFLAFVWPGAGDQFLAYNIPGRPVFHPLTAIFFVIGLALCLWRWRRPAHAFLLGWFAIGILPSLVTGPTAATTRNIAALPAAYILPAVGFVGLSAFLRKRRAGPTRLIVSLALVAWLAAVGLASLGDYFLRWGQSPDVRAAYQHTLIEALDMLESYPPEQATVISTVYPGPVHDPSIARVLFPTETYDLRWVDARRGLVLPGGQAGRLLIPSSTPLHPAFAELATIRQRYALRPTDLDPEFALYDLQTGDWPQRTGQADFDGALMLLEVRWLGEDIQAGQTAELLTAWRVMDPAKVGPRVAPHFETDVAIFTHVLDQAGEILSQWDGLDAPSWGWSEGDLVLQVHPLFVPAETEAGLYPVVVGVYDRDSGRRLPLLDETGAVVDTRAFVVPLTIHGR